MIREVALIVASCVLFVSMGLSDAVQETLHVRFRILSCPKCCTFWAVLLWTLLHGTGFVLSVAASFLSAYAALWAALILDGLSVLYNKCYELISKTSDASQGAGRTREDESDEKDGSYEVSQMQIENDESLRIDKKVRSR